MKSSPRWILVAAVVLVFLAGLACGFFTSPFVLAHRIQHGLMAEHMLDRLQWQLKLTPEQREKIKPIAVRTSQQLQTVRRDAGQRVRDILIESHRAIVPLLTAEQRDQLQRIEQRHRRQMHRFGGQSPRRSEP